MPTHRPAFCALVLSTAVLAMAAIALPACGTAETAGPQDRAPMLFLAGEGELWSVNAEAETAELIRMPELSAGAPHLIVARGDRLVLWGDETYALDPRNPRYGPEVLVEDWSIVLPSDHPDRLWIGVLGPASKGKAQSISAVRELTADGEVTSPDARPPRGAWPEVAVASGLLVSPRRGERAVWDPRTDTVVNRFDEQRLGDVGPAHGDLVASCPYPCRELWLTDIVSGDRTTIAAPSRLEFWVWAGEFSPDGKTIAVPVVERGAGTSGSPTQLALVSLETGEVTVVPGSTVPGGYVFARWTASGGHVFLAGGELFRPRAVVVYELDEERARRLDVEVGDFYDAAGW